MRNNIIMKFSSKIAILFVLLFITSCYTDTVDSFSKFTVQIPIYFYDYATDRQAPSFSKDFTNLYKYAEYKDNIDRIDLAEIYQFTYWIDSLEHPETKLPFNPATDEMIFDYVKYIIIFLKPKSPFLIESQDTNDFEINPDYPEFVIADKKNVKVTDYYRTPKNIMLMDELEAKKISDILKSNPAFYIVTEYSKYQGQSQDPAYFPLMNVRSDLIIRLTVKL